MPERCVVPAADDWRGRIDRRSRTDDQRLRDNAPLRLPPPVAMKAIMIPRFGVPAEVAELVDLPEPGAPSADEVLVAVEASPINPSDQLKFAGKYGATPPPLPTDAGGAAIGRVLAKGAAVAHLREGDRVMVSLAALGTWRERMVVKAARLFALPAADMVQTALLGANPPTALLMLRECVPLQAGDWVMQNAANSSVGVSLIQIAKARGLHTVNVVRRSEQVAPLQAFGADVVLVDGPDLAARVAQASAGARIRLGIDAIAGDAVERMAQCMAEDGVIVNYGLLSGKPCSIDPSHIVFRGVSLRGFWFSRWQKTASAEAIRALYLELVQMVQQGRHHIPVEATYTLARFREALAHASREGRNGKVVLLPNG